MDAPSNYSAALRKESKFNRYFSTLIILLILTQVIYQVNGRVLLVAIPVSKSANSEENKEPKTPVDEKVGEKIFPFLTGTGSGELSGSGEVSGSIGFSGLGGLTTWSGAPEVVNPNSWHNAVLNVLVEATHGKIPFWNLNNFGDEGSAFPHENVDCTSTETPTTSTETPTTTTEDPCDVCP